MKHLLVTVALLGAVLSVPVQEEGALQEFREGNRKFAAEIYKESIKDQTGNVLISPFGIETTLALLNEGTKGETAEELVEGLHLPQDNKKVQEAYKELLSPIEERRTKYSNQNKVFFKEGSKLDENFESLASIYKSDFDYVDFSNDAAKEAINTWIYDNTERHFGDFVGDDNVNEDSSMVLVNAVYLKGRYENILNDYDRILNFYKSKDEIIELYAMWQSGKPYNYWENDKLNAKFLELPLQDANSSIVFVLPHDIEGLANLEENIEQVLEPQPFVKQEVNIHLAKCTTTNEYHLVPTLKKLGIKNVFGPNADLSGLSSSTEDSYISDIVQKVSIIYRETQIVVEAATDAEAAKKTDGRKPPPAHIKTHEEKIAKREVPAPKLEDGVAEFKADHPYFYYIQYNGVVAFTGRCIDPIRP